MATLRSPILGPDGRPIEKRILVEEQAGPTVTGVRPVWSEHPSQGLTPRGLGSILLSAEQGDATSFLELAEDIEEKYWHYRAVIATRKLAVSQLPVTVEAASDDADDVRAADLVRAVIDGDDFDQVLFDALDGLAKGFSVCEIVWETSAREWMPARILHRDPRWFQFDRIDGTTLRLRDGTPDGQPLAPAKYIVHRPKTKSGLPIRGGVARPAAWAWLFQSYTWKDWLSFVETYGQPLRLGRYGPGATETEKQALLRAVRNISADAAAIIPQSMLIEFVKAEGTGASADVYAGLVDRLDQAVSKLVLGQTTTTDAVSGGHAVSQEHRQVQQDIERADGRQLAAVLKRDLIIPLVALNLGPRDRYPTIRIGRPDEEDLRLMLDAVEKGVPLGLKVGMSTFRDKFGIPDPGDDEELLAAPTAPAPPAPAGGAPLRTPPRTDGRPALAAAQAPDQAPAAGDAVDRMVDELLADWVPLAAPVIEPLLTAAREATDAADFLERLARLVADDAALEPLRDALARGQFAARVTARVGYGPGTDG